jgi:tetratricopeptide (TPR) repeat protein
MKRSLLFAIFAAMQISLVAQTKLPDTYAFSRGVESFQQGKSQDALDWFNKEVNDHPDDGYAFIYISTLRYSNNEYGKALTAINQALKKLPKKDKEYAAIAHATRASIYLVMEDTISAIHDYDAAIKLEPAKTTYYNSRAQIYFEQNHYDLADADYNQMINIDPGNVMGYMGIGRNARERKDYDAAIEKLF